MKYKFQVMVALTYEDKEIEGEFDEIGEPFTTRSFVNKLTQ